jgi:hypothetical protein
MANYLAHMPKLLIKTFFLNHLLIRLFLPSFIQVHWKIMPLGQRIIVILPNAYVLLDA